MIQTMFGHIKVGDNFWIDDEYFEKIPTIMDGCCSPRYTANCLTKRKPVYINYNYVVYLGPTKFGNDLTIELKPTINKVELVDYQLGFEVNIIKVVRAVKVEELGKLQRLINFVSNVFIAIGGTNEDWRVKTTN